jgi:hypothetical protein
MFHKTETIGERVRISKCPKPSLESVDAQFPTDDVAR